uniref:GH18 domain-containing protein n=1 Tax=Ciona savignyi TaxID=51511 RepID=H2YC17_CIOSA
MLNMLKASLFIFVCMLASAKASLDCFCQDASLCKPVTKTYTKELIVFTSAKDESWKQYNWTQVTNVILFGDNDYKELYCYAHSRGVRVTILVGVAVNDFPKLSQASFRKQVLTGWINKMQNLSLDGLNIDIEGAAYTKDVVDGISALTSETNVALKSLNPNYLLTWDIPYSPILVGCFSGYCFDYVAIAKSTDYMIVMDYDATIDILFASANSPLPLIKESYNLYLNNFSISPDQLVMAVPWYGYDYTCSKFFNRTGDNLCLIAGAPNSQRGFADINQQFTHNIGGLKWDPRTSAPFFTTSENGAYHQYWYDDPESLRIKYELALSLNLRGLGMWTAEMLDYSSTSVAVKTQTKNMWDMIVEYA